MGSALFIMHQPHIPLFLDRFCKISTPFFCHDAKPRFMTFVQKLFILGCKCNKRGCLFVPFLSDNKKP